MRFSLVLVGTLAGLATALPQGGNGKGRVGRPVGQNNQNNQANAAATAQPPQAVNTAASAVQTPPAAAGNGKGNGKGNGAQNAATSVANNQPAQNTAAAGNANAGNANNGNANAGNANNNGQFNAALVPEFGIKAGQQPDGTGNCIGNNNVKIPCACPPDRQQFIQKVQAAAAAGNSEGVPIKFPTDNSSQSKKDRIGASIIVLQNLNGKGKGCPAAATTFLAQQAAA